MLLIIFIVFLVAALICILGGFKLGNSVGVFFLLIGLALLIATGALINVEGVQIEEQAVIQDAPDVNSGAKVIDFSYTSYTAEDHLSIRVLSFALWGIGIFLLLLLIMGVFMNGI